MCGKPRQCTVNIIDLQTQMMHAWAVLAQPFGDASAGLRGLHQFDVAFTDRQERHTHTFAFNIFNRRDRQPQRIAIKRQRVVDIRDSDGEMV